MFQIIVIACLAGAPAPAIDGGPSVAPATGCMRVPVGDLVPNDMACQVFAQRAAAEFIATHHDYHIAKIQCLRV